jgi:rod shape-determining protein MreC
MLLAALATFAAAAVLFVSPPSVQRVVRSAALDLIGGGQARALVQYESIRSLVLARFARLESTAKDAGPSIDRDSQARAAAIEQTCRRLRLENARLREELSLAEKYGVSPAAAAPQPQVEVPFVVRADVISGGTPRAAAERFLSSGRSHGLAELDVVVAATGPHLDQGSEAGVEPELDVLIGRCVVGRISAVGRWTSVLQPITDPHYRGLVQIVRPSEQGGSFGAEGILVGLGNELCGLTDVPTTQSVRIGDDVYTSDRDRRFPISLYYGRVVRVTEAGRNWDISVRPAARVGDLKTVDVLRFTRAAGKTLAE